LGKISGWGDTMIYYFMGLLLGISIGINIRTLLDKFIDD